MIRSARKRGLAALLSVGVLLAGTVFTVMTSSQATALAAPVPPPASAVELRCDAPSTNGFGFAPHLSLVTQMTQIQRTTIYRGCSAPAFPNIRSGHEHKTNNLMDDCNIMLNATGNANFAITWNTGQTSTLGVTRSSFLSGTTLTVSFTGTVTAGLFAGRRVRQVFTADATELIACLNGTGKLPILVSDVSLTIYI